MLGGAGAVSMASDSLGTGRLAVPRRADGLPRPRLTLVSAPGGYGKTTLARSWREALEADGLATAWLSVSPDHSDPVLFVEDLLAALRASLASEASDTPDAPAFGDRVARLFSQAGLPHASRVARELVAAAESAPPRVLFLDGFETLDRDGLAIAIVDALLRVDASPLVIVICTRGTRPGATSALLASGDAFEIDAEALSLRADEIRALLVDAGLEPDEELLARVLAQTRGWAIAVRLLIRALSSAPAERRLELLQGACGREDVFAYIAAELVGRAKEDALAVAEVAAVLGPASRGLLCGACREAGVEAVLDDALDAGLLTSDEGRVAMHDLWREWFVERLRSRRVEDAWTRMQTAVGRALEAAGESERSLDHYAAAIESPNARAAVVRLLSTEADRWVSLGHRHGVERALARMTDADRADAPALQALEGLLLSGRDPDRAIHHLQAAATAYREAGNTRAEFMCLHELSVVAINENRMEEVWTVFRRALGLRRVVLDPVLRGFVVMALGQGSMLLGRYRAALRLCATALTYDHDPRERGGIVIVQTSIQAQSGAWDASLQGIADLMSRAEQRQHGITYCGVETARCAILSARGEDVEAVDASLAEVIETFETTRHTMSLLRAWYVRGRHETSLGRDEAALRSFEQAEALAAGSEYWAACAAARGCRARTLARLGRVEEARAAATDALELLEGEEGWAARRGRVLSWSVGIALAAATAADLGEAERARAFLDRFGSRIAQPDLPLCQHALLVLSARVAEAAGDPTGARRSLGAAWTKALRADLRDLAPELDADLVRWAVEGGAPKELSSSSLAACLARLGVSPTARPALVLRSLGALDVARNGRGVPARAWRGATPRRLLGRLLVAEGRPVTRERLQADLWPEMPASRAASNLRVALSHLRSAIEPRRRRGSEDALLAVDRRSVAISAAGVDAWDVTRLRAALDGARDAADAADVATGRDELRRLQDLFVPFLPELYDDWIDDYRRALDRERVEASEELAAAWRARGESELAAGYARLTEQIER